MNHVTNRYFDRIVEEIVRSVSFDSSQKPKEGNYPFGKACADCLKHFLDLASSMGFETHNYDNYAGEVVFGEGEELAILAHLDVVPAGSGWKYPPFGGTINDDVSDGGTEGTKIWGRGTMDDKGPAIVTLFAMKALKDEGFLPKRKIKFIVGCNEESGWECLKHYKQVAHMPDEGFSPDADFPAIYAEKGILHFTANFPVPRAPFSSFFAGERVNMVCDEAVAILTSTDKQRLANYRNEFPQTTFSFCEETSELKVKGKSAHGSTPELGANALESILAFFAEENEGLKKAYDVLFADVLKLKELEDETGKLTMSPNVARYEKGVLSVTTDIRFPATLKKEDVLSRLDEKNIDYRIESYQAPLYNDPNGKLISTLMNVYNKVTGKNEKAIAIGGGTYARALKCGCAFGPELPGEEATIHQANEYITFDRIRLAAEIYYEAIKQLTL